ncbi:hypothetical protein FRX31_020144 [Thalictrum thalictroides]|uniref:Uncharacterized protein n=1 Tax=Thalictrum thalictroides TaxID=46969 RepID=A0A7J6VYS8_THATH|nr:hypothetical protein FRX31_020144 [Thalictrum thalictroides]
MIARLILTSSTTVKHSDEGMQGNCQTDHTSRKIALTTAANRASSIPWNQPDARESSGQRQSSVVVKEKFSVSSAYNTNQGCQTQNIMASVCGTNMYILEQHQ